MSRCLNRVTIDASVGVVQRFQEHSGEFPGRWTPAHLEEWTTDLRSVRHVALSTVRSYQSSVRRFLGYVCDPIYESGIASARTVTGRTRCRSVMSGTRRCTATISRGARIVGR